MPITLQRIMAIVLVCIVAPLFLLIALITLIDSGWPIIYWQRRVGKDKKSFWIWKFRTMKQGAEKQQERLARLNEADGPVFKIRHDPRFTKFGKLLSWSGLDELPQLLNVLRGEMALVGPRPLPVNEAKEIGKKYSDRFRILPGITSSWVVMGAHALTFREWMNLDLEYVKNRSWSLDLKIMAQTGIMLLRLILSFITQAEQRVAEYLIQRRGAVLAFIVISGGLIRLIRMKYELIWNDEMFYLSVAKSTTLLDLVKTNHWIIDHPPLYLVLQHFWSQISTSPLWLRFPNLFFYLLSSYFIYKIGQKLFRSPLTGLLLSAVYAFFPYFVSIEWQAIPYAMTISFFLMSFYYFWLMVGQNSKKSTGPAATFTALFLYSSFEAGYYILSLLLFWVAIFPFVVKEIRWRMIAFFCLTLVLILPEIWVLMGNFGGFARLSTHWLLWRWEGRAMLNDVFGITNLSVILILAAIGILYLAAEMMLKHKTRLKMIFLTSCSVGFFIALSMVSKFFFYASNPKAYYYFILMVWITVLTIGEWGKSKYKRKFSAGVIVFLLSSVVWFYPAKYWVKADYLYISDTPEPYTLRQDLMSKLREDQTWIVLTDEEMGGDPDFNGYYIDKYYLECLDMPKSEDCLRMKAARAPLEEVLNDEGKKLIGVLADIDNQNYFEKGICALHEQCLIWDFTAKSFRKIK